MHTEKATTKLPSSLLAPKSYVAVWYCKVVSADRALSDHYWPYIWVKLGRVHVSGRKKALMSGVEGWVELDVRAGDVVCEAQLWPTADIRLARRSVDAQSQLHLRFCRGAGVQRPPEAEGIANYRRRTGVLLTDQIQLPRLCSTGCVRSRQDIGEVVLPASVAHAHRHLRRVAHQGKPEDLVAERESHLVVLVALISTPQSSVPDAPERELESLHQGRVSGRRVAVHSAQDARPAVEGDVEAAASHSDPAASPEQAGVRGRHGDVQSVVGLGVSGHPHREQTGHQIPVPQLGSRGSLQRETGLQARDWFGEVGGVGGDDGEVGGGVEEGRAVVEIEGGVELQIWPWR